MWIDRDLSNFIESPDSLPVQVVWGPRQCGKSSLLRHLSPHWNFISLDDLQARTTAQNDPALFLSQNPLPVIIDEAQYSPNLFPQVKLLIDEQRYRQTKPKNSQIRLSGSHQILLDKRIKESLAGRATFFRLHGLSLMELKRTGLSLSIEEFLFRGGWPELYTSQLNAVDYLNDYLNTVVDKDVALSSGVRDLDLFHRALGVLAARVGELINFESIGSEVGVSGMTLKSWVATLERSGLTGFLRPFHSNLNKRLIKSPKFYFTDTGLAVRLQGHLDISLMFRSPQMGHLFENLVLTEILKCRDHFRLQWNIYFWRTKEGEEYDFLIETNNKCIVLDAQVAIQSAQGIKISEKLRRDLQNKQIVTAVCTYGGTQKMLSKDCHQVPIINLAEFLINHSHS